METLLFVLSSVVERGFNGPRTVALCGGNMPILEIVIAAIGVALLCVSLVMYQTRTHDEKFLTRFWLGRRLLTSREYVLNRVGFTLAVSVIVIRIARLAFAFLR